MILGEISNPWESQKIKLVKMSFTAYLSAYLIWNIRFFFSIRWIYYIYSIYLNVYFLSSLRLARKPFTSQHSQKKKKSRVQVHQSQDGDESMSVYARRVRGSNVKPHETEKINSWIHYSDEPCVLDRIHRDVSSNIPKNVYHIVTDNCQSISYILSMIPYDEYRSFIPLVLIHKRIVKYVLQLFDYIFKTICIPYIFRKLFFSMKLRS